MFTLSVSVFSAGLASANPVLADEISISNGAQIYELYCSECHGRDPDSNLDQLYETDEVDLAEYSALVDMVVGDESAQMIAVPEEESWPEWADRPDPNAENKPDVNAEILQTVTSAIDEAQVGGSSRDGPGYTDDNPDDSDVQRFNPIPGVTDLTDPTAYFYGTSEQAVFNSIANGTGSAMPGWRTELGDDEAIWDVVNYIRSFWDEHWR